MDEAIAEFRASLRLNSDSAPTHYNLGYALSARGRRDEAMAEFAAALAIDPGYALAHNNLGALLQASGRLDEAQAHFARAVSLSPDNVEARDNLGQLLSNRGDLAGAAEQFSAVLALRPDNVQALSASRGFARPPPIPLYKTVTNRCAGRRARCARQPPRPRGARRPRRGLRGHRPVCRRGPRRADGRALAAAAGQPAVAAQFISISPCIKKANRSVCRVPDLFRSNFPVSARPIFSDRCISVGFLLGLRSSLSEPHANAGTCVTEEEQA